MQRACDKECSMKDGTYTCAERYNWEIDRLGGNKTCEEAMKQVNEDCGHKPGPGPSQRGLCDDCFDAYKAMGLCSREDNKMYYPIRDNKDCGTHEGALCCVGVDERGNWNKQCDSSLTCGIDQPKNIGTCSPAPPPPPPLPPPPPPPKCECFRTGGLFSTSCKSNCPAGFVAHGCKDGFEPCGGTSGDDCTCVPTS
jgi:hypothetical protein